MQYVIGSILRIHVNERRTLQRNRIRHRERAYRPSRREDRVTVHLQTSINSAIAGQRLAAATVLRGGQRPTTNDPTAGSFRRSAPGLFLSLDIVGAWV